MTFLVLANFKSHKLEGEVLNWLKTVSPALKNNSSLKLLVAPALLHLPAAHAYLSTHPTNVELVAQDASPFPPGAYTGAINAQQLKEYGVSYSLVGHSERRKYFHENHQDVANKVKELLSNGITPAICLSRDDIVPQFAALSDDLQNDCLYCFEPPADIGGTTTAPLDLIRDTVDMIKKYTSAKVLYGGSVTPENVASLLELPIDGVLVATASLEASSLTAIISTCSHAR